MIKLYHMTGCPHCEEAMLVLNRLNIKYEGINLKEKNRREERKLFRTSGVDIVPIIILENGKIITDCSEESILDLIKYGDLKCQ